MLNTLGFSNIDAKVYIYIAKLGPLSDEEIASHLEITSEQLVPILELLVKKGVITPIIKNRLFYSALMFEDLLNEFIQSDIAQTQKIKDNHKQLVSLWKNTIEIDGE